MHPDSFVVIVLQLARGILSIQSPSAPVELAQAVEWSVAAAYHATESGLDPFELVAIARNETDFRPGLVGPDGKDCGLTQIRVTYSRYRCKELRDDPWLAFSEAARKLRENQDRCEQRNPRDVRRCRLNSYNSGVRYARRGWKGAYWARVGCFAEAARAGVTPRGNCRHARSERDIARLVGPPAPSLAVSEEARPTRLR